MAHSLLVTGAAGHLGRLVVENLLAAGGTRVIAGSRDPAKLADLKAKGAEVRRVDFDDAASLSSAFAGVDRLVIVSTDALDAAGTRLRQHSAAIAAAKAAGVKRIVYTSMLNPDAPSAITFAHDHFGTEQALKASSVPHTILRVSWYQENLKMALPAAFASGQWFSAAGQGRLSHIARADVAAAAAAALRAPDGPSQTLDLTGDALRTTDEIAALAAQVVGKPLQVVHVTDEQLAAGLAAHGVPAPMIPFIVGFDTNTRQGKMDVASDAFLSLTGRDPRTLAEYFAANMADFG